MKINYDKLVEKNPTKYAEYKNGWDNRLDRLWSAAEQQQSPNQVAFNSGGVVVSDTQQPAPLPFNGQGVDQIASATVIDQNTVDSTVKPTIPLSLT